MDQALLEALQATLCILSEVSHFYRAGEGRVYGVNCTNSPDHRFIRDLQAQEGVEGDTALMRVAQANLLDLARRNR